MLRRGGQQTVKAGHADRVLTACVLLRGVELDRRTWLAPVATAVMLAYGGAGASAALAPKPLAGEWIGTSQTEFTVSADHKPIP